MTTTAHSSTGQTPPPQPPATRRGSRPTGTWAAWRRPRVLGTAATVVVVLVAVVLAAATGLLPWRDYVERQPPHYIALSFADPSGLPTRASAGQPVAFAFDLTNPAPDTRSLHWTTSVRDPATGRTRDLDAGAVVVPGRGQVRTPQRVVLDGTGRQQVTVTIGTGEVISFYVTVSGSGSSGGA